MSDLFGSGFSYPSKIEKGTLALTTGKERLLSVPQTVIETQKGSCPMDPLFGDKLDVYDPVNNYADMAWRLTNAIEYAEPRAASITATLTKSDPVDGSIEINVGIVPIGERTPVNRTFPFYRKNND